MAHLGQGHAAFRGRPVVGASAELIRHHYGVHRKACPAESEYAERICAATVILRCGTCREPLFVAARPGTWCSHAEGAVRRAKSS